jgi:uncharacterized repeat protein (TIGR03803 family)
MRRKSWLLNRLLAVIVTGLNVVDASGQVTAEAVTGFGDSIAFNPYIGGGLIKGTDGAFYGTTYDSINTRCGTVYKVLADGTLTVLHEFQGHFAPAPDGCRPMGELVEGADGSLYGTTFGGGANGDATFPSGTGTVFKISKDGDSVAYSLVHSFAGYDASLTYWPEGVGPIGGLTIGLDGNFYGTTSFSGAGSVGGGNCTSLGGTVFRLSPFDATGTPTILHAFSFPEGCAPTNLTVASDGSLLGTTIQGGNAGGDQSLGGMIFKITTTGAFSRLAVFPGTISSGTPYGYSPYAAPVEASDGTLYGTTTSGGPSAGGNESGTIYKCVPLGSMCELSLLHPFTNEDGGYPFAGLTIGTDGILYGATSAGGEYTNGVLFQITIAGAFTQLYSFNSSDPSFNGGVAYARLLRESAGTFFGTTFGGGSPSRSGTVFRFTVGSPTTTGLQVSPSSTVFGQGVTLTATVSSARGTPTGEVEFFDGATLLGTSTLSDGAATIQTTTLSVGPHGLSASYLGDGGFLSSTSPNASVTVGRATTTTTLASAPNPSTRKQLLIVTATVAAIVPAAGIPTGQVQFFDGKKRLGTATLASGAASLQVAFNSMGSHGLTATYGGDGNFVGSASVPLTHTVSR